MLFCGSTSFFKCALERPIISLPDIVIPRSDRRLWIRRQPHGPAVLSWLRACAGINDASYWFRKCTAVAMPHSTRLDWIKILILRWNRPGRKNASGETEELRGYISTATGDDFSAVTREKNMSDSTHTLNINADVPMTSTHSKEKCSSPQLFFNSFSRIYITGRESCQDRRTMHWRSTRTYVPGYQRYEQTKIFQAKAMRSILNSIRGSQIRGRSERRIPERNTVKKVKQSHDAVEKLYAVIYKADSIRVDMLHTRLPEVTRQN